MIQLDSDKHEIDIETNVDQQSNTIVHEGNNIKLILFTLIFLVILFCILVFGIGVFGHHIHQHQHQHQQ